MFKFILPYWKDIFGPSVRVSHNFFSKEKTLTKKKKMFLSVNAFFLRKGLRERWTEHGGMTPKIKEELEKSIF